MKRTKTTLYVCLWGTIALMFAGVFLRTFAMVTNFDATIGYFKEGILSVVCRLISVLAVLFPAVVCMVIPKDQLPSAWADRTNNIVAVLPCCLLAAFGVYQFIFPTSTTATASGILAIAGMLYFAFSLIPSMREGKVTLLAPVGLFVIAWALVSLAETYFDLFTTMNNPIKTILQFSFLSVALMITAELRFRLGKATPRMALCLHCISLYFCTTGGVSTLTAFAVHTEAVSTLHAMYAMVLMGMGLYTAVRIMTYIADFLTPAPCPDHDVQEEDNT